MSEGYGGYHHYYQQFTNLPDLLIVLKYNNIDNHWAKLAKNTQIQQLK